MLNLAHKLFSLIAKYGIPNNNKNDLRGSIFFSLHFLKLNSQTTNTPLQKKDYDSEVITEKFLPESEKQSTVVQAV